VRKELKSYYNSPIAYIVIGAFLVFMSIWLFVLQRFLSVGIADLRIFFSVIPYVFVFIIPAITMRSWAEEKKMGTEEILLTLPFKEFELVIGKFIAPLILLFIMLLLTLPIPITLSALGNFEWGQIIGQYIGVLFFGAACIALGLFISSLSTNQIVAFVFGALSLFVIIIVSDINLIVNFPPFLSDVLNWISFRFHYDTLAKGLIETKDLMFFVIMSFFFLYLNVKAIVFKKWQ
jgi:ABC-2 type transport system permease protein